MTNINIINLFKERLANITIGPSTLRGQGKGSAEIARDYLQNIDLDELKNIKQEEFIKWLNKHTEILSKELPNNNFGAARKVLNIFIFEAAHNLYLSEYYNLKRFIAYFETPLDNIAAKRLVTEAKNEGKQLYWKNIKSLKKEDSDKLQIYAKEYAKENKLEARCYLELILWRKIGSNKTKKLTDAGKIVRL